jgi:uncharacterized DUF497 family protein
MSWVLWSHRKVPGAKPPAADEPLKTKGTHRDTLLRMKAIVWSAEKNEILKAERGVCFEDVVFHIQAGDLLETFDHPNQKRYPGQLVHAVAIEEYVYLVPFVETQDEVFLKTIIPSRKATKRYKG